VGSDENVLSVESLLGLRLGFVHCKSDTVVLGEALGGSIMESGKVHWVGGEAIESALGSIWSSDKGGMLLGQSPQNATWYFHVLFMMKS